MNYRPNHLNMLSVTAENCSRFPAYPSPWFLILDDRGVILGDGQTPDEAGTDFALGRDPNSPSSQAAARLSFLERQARKARKARRQKRAENAQKIAPTSSLLAGLLAREPKEEDHSLTGLAREASAPAMNADNEDVGRRVLEDKMREIVLEKTKQKMIDAARDKIIDELINAQVDIARQKMIDHHVVAQRQNRID